MLYVNHFIFIDAFYIQTSSIKKKNMEFPVGSAGLRI